MTNTTWKSVAPAQACDWAEFLLNAPWPMDNESTCKYAAQLGWDIVEEDGESYLMDNVSGITAIETYPVDLPSGEVSSISFYLTDVIRGEASEDAAAFLSDSFTLACREAEKRWGKGKLVTESNHRRMMWTFGDGKGRIDINQRKHAVGVTIITPQYLPYADD